MGATPSNVGDVDNVHFTWTYNGTQILEGDGAANATVSARGHGYGTYEVIAYGNDPNRTSNPEGINIQQKNLSINLSVNDEDMLYCIGETVIFTAELTDEASDEIDFVWYENGDVVAGETGFTLSVTVEELAGYSVEVSVGGCVATAGLSIGTYERGCEIPRGISPPGTADGIALI